jgi:hypothetical protein
MKDQARQGIAAAALLVIAAVAHQHINGVQCFTLSQSRYYPRGHQRIAPNARPHALYYRIDGDNQTDHETTSSKSENMIIEIQNQNATRDDIEKNESQSNIIWGKKLGYAESGTLGDIMSGASQDDNSLDDTRTVDRIRTNVGEDDREVMSAKLKEGTEDNKSTQSGLVTSIGGTLTSQFGQKVPNLSPLDRIALTANGNLQRIFSSFYDAPVHVHVNHCVKRASGFPVEGSEKDLENAVWDRVVHLAVFDQVSVNILNFMWMVDGMSIKRVAEKLTAIPSYYPRTFAKQHQSSPYIPKAVRPLSNRVN